MKKFLFALVTCLGLTGSSDACHFVSNRFAVSYTPIVAAFAYTPVALAAPVCAPAPVQVAPPALVEAAPVVASYAAVSVQAAPVVYGTVNYPSFAFASVSPYVAVSSNVFVHNRVFAVNRRVVRERVGVVAPRKQVQRTVVKTRR